MSAFEKSTTPWYKQFWPWFIFALPATVVVAGLTTVYIAFKHADDLVKDDYYKEGLAINRELGLDDVATEYGVGGRLFFDPVTGEVLFDLKGDVALPSQVQLSLLHPMDESRDQVILMQGTGNNRFRGDVEVMPASRFYLRLKPLDGIGWRLNGEINFDQTTEMMLEPDSAS